MFIACIYLLNLLSSQNKEAGLFVATQTGPGDHFRLPKVVPPGPILVAKFGPARTSFGKRGPILATKSGPGGPFLAAKIGQGDHFWVGPILA